MGGYTGKLDDYSDNKICGMLHVNKTVEIASHSLCIFSIVLVVSISK
jgi:hypothetical protein